MKITIPQLNIIKKEIKNIKIIKLTEIDFNYNICTECKKKMFR